MQPRTRGAVTASPAQAYHGRIGNRVSFPHEPLPDRNRPALHSRRRWIARIPFGRLPGDIHIVRDGFSIHFPIVTCIVISVVVSVLLWLLRR